MTLIFMIAVSVLVAGAFVYFWNDILKFLNGTVRDIIQKIFGEVWSDRFAELLVWLNKGVGLIKSTAKAYYDWFKSTVLRIDVVYDDIQSKNITKTTTTLVRLNDGMGQETKITEPVNWSELPENVADDVIRSRAETAAVNGSETVDRRYQDQIAVAH